MYIELYALDNMLMDALILRLAASLVARKAGIKRLLLFSFIGSVMATISIVWPIALSLPAKLIQGCVLAFFLRWEGIRRYIESVFAVLIRACIASGTALALSQLANAGGEHGGALLLPRFARLMLISAAAALLLPRLIRAFRQKRAFSCGAAKLSFSAFGKNYELCAIRDSGCTLAEPVSGLPVIIAYLPELNENAHIPVPMHSVAGSAMVYAFVPDKVSIDGVDTDALIAVISNRIHGADALIPYQIAKESL